MFDRLDATTTGTEARQPAMLGKGVVVMAGGTAQNVRCATAKRRVDIEELLRWTYQDQRAAEVLGKGGLEADLRMLTCGGSTAEAIGRILALGTMVDGGGAWGEDLHQDAEIVHAAVGKLSWMQSGLVFFHATRGDQPDWMPEVGQFGWQPVRGPRGKPKMMRDDHRNEIGCWIQFVGGDDYSVEEVATKRAIYQEWLACLADLAEMLSDDDRLTAHDVTGPAAALAPWA